jgi:hypothetical protein
MKHTRTFRIRSLATLLVVIALTAIPVWAQSEIELHSVSPNRGRAGEELELTLRGRGFCGPATVQIGAFEAADVRVESDSTIRARIYLPDHALPGPYPVLVIVDCGGPQETFSAALEGGFTVLEPPGGQPSEPRNGDEGRGDEGEGDDGGYGGGLDWLVVVAILGGGLVLLAGAAIAVTVAIKLRQSALKKKWQAESEEGELPKICQPGSHRIVRSKPKLKPGRWKVTGLKVVLHDASSDRKGDVHDAPAELARRIDRAVRDRLLWGDSDRLGAEAIEIGRALAAQVVAWQALSQRGRDVWLEPEIAGGEGSVTYTYYRCVGAPQWWQKVRSWQVKVQVVRHFQKGFRGPAADEAPEPYRAVLEKGITLYVLDLIREASRLWDTEGAGVSVEVSLE